MVLRGRDTAESRDTQTEYSDNVVKESELSIHGRDPRRLQLEIQVVTNLKVPLA